MFPHTKPLTGTQINPLHQLSKGLVGCWLFNEGAGSLVNDISGYKNHGRLTNVAPNVQGSGWGSDGLEFDGVDDYVDCGNVFNFERTDPFSLEAWVKTTDGNKAHVVGKEESSSVYTGYKLNIDGDKLELWLVSNYGTGNRIHIRETASGAVIDDKWHHVIATCDGSSTAAGCILYVDGDSLATTVVADGLSASIINSNPLTIGRMIDGSYPHPLDGSINSVSIYNRALSAEEVKTLYLDPFCNMMKRPINRYYVAVAEGLSMAVAMHHYNQMKEN